MCIIFMITVANRFKISNNVIIVSEIVLLSSVQVCPGGNTTLTCSTNGTLLIWSIALPNKQVTERFVSGMGSADSQIPLIIDQTTIYFLRTSTSPLISMITFTNVNVELNGTRVDCIYGGVTETNYIHVYTFGNGNH